MKRIAPQAGYTFGNKAQYRRDVWSKFRRHFRNQTSNLQAALLPSAEGKEIEVALDNGFREYNLHVIDQNPAIVAVLKRKYPRINTYGVSADRAVDRMFHEGVDLHCANWDFCGPLLSKAMHFQLAACLDPAFYASENCIAVTCLNGRDEPNSFALLKSIWKSEEKNELTGNEIRERLLFFYATKEHTEGHIQLSDLGNVEVLGRFGERHSRLIWAEPFRVYKSAAGTPMFYIIMGRHTLPCSCSVCNQAIQNEQSQESKPLHVNQILSDLQHRKSSRGGLLDIAVAAGLSS